MVRKKKEPVEKPRRRFDHFITTVPVLRPCAVCGRWLAAGIVDGMHTEVDLTQLDQAQALLAIVCGLQLYCLTRTGLVHLDRDRLQDPRFAGRLPEHRCLTVWQSKVPGAGPVLPPSKSDTPPY